MRNAHYTEKLSCFHSSDRNDIDSTHQCEQYLQSLLCAVYESDATNTLPSYHGSDTTISLPPPPPRSAAGRTGVFLEQRRLLQGAGQPDVLGRRAGGLSVGGGGTLTAGVKTTHRQTHVSHHLTGQMGVRRSDGVIRRSDGG